MTRKLISIVLAMCMIMSCFALSGISASAATATDSTASAGDTITVKFTDALNWGSVKVYYWGTTSDPAWPGTAMEKDVVNDYGQQVYKATIPAAATGVITGVIFNGGGAQTVDITTGIVDGAQWYPTGEWENSKAKVGYVEPENPTTAPVDETTAPVVETTAPVVETTAPVVETTAPAGDTITVKFTDALNWGSVKIYYWTDGPAWPGTAMEKDVVNDYGQQVYKATIPAAATGVMLSSTTAQLRLLISQKIS